MPVGATVARSISVTERFAKAAAPKLPAGKSGAVHVGVHPARNSVTRPFTTLAAPTAAAAGGAPPVKTKTPSEVLSSVSGWGSWK